MVGGVVIEAKPMEIESESHPAMVRKVVRLWCINRKNADEVAVYASADSETPKVGDEIWWQYGRIMWGPNDSKSCAKVGYSFQPKERADD